MRKTRSFSIRLSEEEAGRRCSTGASESQPQSPVTPARSPVTPKHLFIEEAPSIVQGSVLQRLILISLIVLSIWAWQPVVLWAWRRGGASRGVDGRDSSAFDLDSASEGQPHVLAFYEAGCSGESILVTGEADLCAMHFPSGIPAKDNVASVLLDGSRHELRVYATCRIEEAPINEMLLETIHEQGCVDLKYPICANLQLRQLLEDGGDGAV